MKPHNEYLRMTTKFEDVFNNMESKLHNIKALNLTSADGFTLFSQFSGGFKFESNKLSAVTSSITALSQAAAKQIIKSNFESTCIETDAGVIFMVQTKYGGKNCILSLISGENPNLGQIRYYLLKLAKYLETANLSAE